MSNLSLTDNKPKQIEIRQFKSEEIQNKTILKNEAFLKFYSANIINPENIEFIPIDVLIISIKNFQNNMKHFDSLIFDTYLYKLKSNYFLKKIGYHLNYTDNSFSLIYQLPPGSTQLLSFQDFESLENNETSFSPKTLCYLEKVINIMSKLNSAKINLGIIDPCMFLVNPGNEYPIILIDYMLNNIVRERTFNYEDFPSTSSNSHQFSKISKFYPESFDKILSNTHLAVLFITKCFLAEKRPEFSYERILFKFVKEFWRDVDNNPVSQESQAQAHQDKNQEINDSKLNTPEGDAEKQPESEFKNLVNDKIRNKRLKKLLLKYLPNKEKDKDLMTDNFSEFSSDFYELVYKSNLAKYKCNECLSSIDKLNLKFNDVFCNNCLKKIPYKDTRLNDFIKNFNFVADFRKRIGKMKNVIEGLKFSQIPDPETQNKYFLMLNECFQKVEHRNENLVRLTAVKKQYLIGIVTSDLLIKKKQIYEKIKLLQDKINENVEKSSFENKSELDEIIKDLDETLVREKTKWEIIAGKIRQGTGFIKEYDPKLTFLMKLNEYTNLLENLQSTILRKIYDDTQLFSDTPKFQK